MEEVTKKNQINSHVIRKNAFNLYWRQVMQLQMNILSFIIRHFSFIQLDKPDILEALLSGSLAVFKTPQKNDFSPFFIEKHAFDNFVLLLTFVSFG